ncbi:MAG: 3',5'-cyclic-AMP phosphodiesterase [Synechococcales bacterium]|nr:3',5'-cyclic-AMP phosphodiesterase [Synechococcales bacterium]
MTHLIAQITDTHLFADPRQTSKGIPTNESFATVLAHLRQMPRLPDVLLLTGDLSQDETPESYRLLWEAIAPLQIPTYWIPGNHDDPRWMGEILDRPPFSLEKRVKIGNWTLLLLDSQVLGAVHGFLSDASLEWLDQQLQVTDTRPALIALHHPPLSVGSAWMDGISLENQAAFQEILHRHPGVRAVICGHIHQELDEVRQGIRYLATPSTCVQFVPKSQEFAIDGDRFPGFRLLTLHDAGDLTTEVIRVPYHPAIQPVSA